MDNSIFSWQIGNPVVRHLLVYLLLVSCCFIPYFNVLHGEFVLDDVAFYVDNAAFAIRHDLAHFFLTGWWENANVQSKAPLYRPLGLVVMWVNQNLFGSNVVAHHLFSIVMHVGATLLLFRLLCILLPGSGVLPSMAGALIFALHPVHVEAVTWIIAYGHLVATVLLLGSLLLYLRHLEHPHWGRYGVSLLLYLLALFVIESAVVFPLLVTAYEYLRYRRVDVRRVLPFWFGLAVYFVVRRLVLGEAIPLEISDIAAWKVMLSYAAASIEYLVLPWPQYVYLTQPGHGIVMPGQGWIALMIVLVALAMMRLKVPNKPIMLFGLGWIAIALSAPVLAGLHPQPLFALRALYLPSAGLSILVAWAVASSAGKLQVSVLGVVAIAAVLAVPAALAANRDWLDNAMVFEKILSVTPEADGAAISLAGIYEKRGDLKAAESTLLRTVDHAQGKEARANILETLGELYGKNGETSKSENLYREVVKLEPKRSTAWVGLGNNAWARGQIREAQNDYLTAIRLDPKNREAVYNAGLAYRQLGDLQLAEEYMRKADQLKAAKP